MKTPDYKRRERLTQIFGNAAAAAIGVTTTAMTGYKLAADSGMTPGVALIAVCAGAFIGTIARVAVISTTDNVLRKKDRRNRNTGPKAP